MDYAGLAINLIALGVGFGVYIALYHSKLAEKLDRYQYPVLLAVLIGVCLIGGLLRFLLFK